jgi:hypothetical protein
LGVENVVFLSIEDDVAKVLARVIGHEPPQGLADRVVDTFDGHKGREHFGVDVRGKEAPEESP